MVQFLKAFPFLWGLHFLEGRKETKELSSSQAMNILIKPTYSFHAYVLQHEKRKIFQRLFVTHMVHVSKQNWKTCVMLSVSHEITLKGSFTFCIFFVFVFCFRETKTKPNSLTYVFKAHPPVLADLHRKCIQAFSVSVGIVLAKHSKL